MMILSNNDIPLDSNNIITLFKKDVFSRDSKFITPKGLEIDPTFEVFYSIA